MYGRYGTDTLNLVLLIAGLVVAFIAQLTRFWPLTFVAYALYIYAIFRMLSRNTAPLQKWFRIRKTAFRERKQYKYFKCPNCRQQLRAPRGRGKIRVTCQRCRKEFNQKT